MKTPWVLRENCNIPHRPIQQDLFDIFLSSPSKDRFLVMKHVEKNDTLQFQIKASPLFFFFFFWQTPILNFPLFFNGNKLGNEKISKLRGQTGFCQSSLQKLIFGNNCQNLCKSRYQSFLVLPNFAWFSYVRWNIL